MTITSTDETNAQTLPYSHELDWPEGLTPWTVIDETGVQGEPYAHFTWMRENHPVLRVAHPQEDVYFVSRYADVRKGMRAAKIYRNQVNDEVPFAFPTLMDGSAHMKIRKVVAAGFTPKAIGMVADRVRDVATEVVDAFSAQGGGEVTEALNRPLTMATISGILGVPYKDVEQFDSWTESVWAWFARVSRMAPGLPGDEEVSQDLFDYLGGILEDLYRQESEAVGGHIARAWVSDGTLTRQQAIELCVFVFIAGFDTTTRLMGGSYLVFRDNPNLLDRLNERPEDSEKFVEELVRFRGPVHKAPRRLAESVEVAGATIPAGSVVRLLLASANRDEAHWGPTAGVFDIDRDTEGHFGFGHGVHQCLGSPLARLEARIMFELLASRIDGVDFDSAHDLALLKGNSLTNGVERLTVKVNARRR
ncbi:cytochrome P450 [Gordonia sp. CPCC 206044]|uniref:cytochrome P450 n=1 Tax=Gordonia sp. CPCC 206044 TaxID=3140793 RepID=UPI003AF38AEA